MRIKDVKELESSVKGFIVAGKVFYIGEVKTRTNKANGEEFTTQSIGVSDGNNKDTDSIFVEFSNQEELTDEIKGKTISCISCRINDWQGKRNLRASSYSTEVIPETSQPELPEVQIEDTAHPILPKTRVIEDKEPAEIQRDEARKKVEPVVKQEPNIWAEKDLRIVRQNSNLHATTLVCKYFKGTLEESIAKVIEMSNIIVSSVYQGIKFPINKKQADLLKGIKAGSDEKVHESELDSLDVKALEYKKQLYTLSGDDIEYGWILKEYDIDQPHDIKDPEKKAELVSKLANRVIKLQKGE